MIGSATEAREGRDPFRARFTRARPRATHGETPTVRLVLGERRETQLVGGKTEVPETVPPSPREVRRRDTRGHQGEWWPVAEF